MYVPWLLAEGKTLYRDTWFMYGPASPYFNSFLFEIFGVHLNVLYWAGSLAALGTAVFLYLIGMRLSSWLIGWAAGAVVLLEAFQPSLFCFPLPYSFAAVYGCLAGCAFLWMAVCGMQSASRGWIFGAGTTAATALMLKPEFGMACYAVLGLLIAARARMQRSWSFAARDVLAILPGIAACLVIIGWMVSLSGVEFITQENIVSWPTSYFMQTYGKMWLERNGFTLTFADFRQALLRFTPLAGFLAVLYGPLWRRLSSRSRWLRGVLAGAIALYLTSNAYFRAPWPEGLELTLAAFFFPRDMVLYVTAAALGAWWAFARQRERPRVSNPVIPLLLTFAALAAFRLLMKMSPGEYAIYYNGPVVLCFLWVLVRFLNRASLPRRTALAAELITCLACVGVAGLYAGRVEARTKEYVPLVTDRGTIRVSASLAQNYAAAITFMKEKAAAGETVLSIPEDTSLYFLSGTYCPMRVFSFTPGIVAPGKMTEAAIAEIEREPVRYLLWSNRTFAEFGVPIFGRDFNREIGDYLRSRYERVGTLVPPTSVWHWTAVVWERKAEVE
jgi:hypothetical protein